MLKLIKRKKKSMMKSMLLMLKNMASQEEEEEVLQNPKDDCKSFEVKFKFFDCMYIFHYLSI